MPRRTGKMTLPVSVLLGFMPLVTRGVQLYQVGGIQALPQLSSSLVPYDFQTRRVSFANLGSGLYPIIAGLVVHKLAGALGINRALSAARIPFIRL